MPPRVGAGVERAAAAPKGVAAPFGGAHWIDAGVVGLRGAGGETNGAFGVAPNEAREDAGEGRSEWRDEAREGRDERFRSAFSMMR